jgi:circadian clock protein KaiC
MRNMRSIGLDLEPWVKKGLLRFDARRSTACGLETHLVTFHQAIQEFQPQVVVFDPINNLLHAGLREDVTAMATRLIDYLKMHGITALMTNLASGQEIETSEMNISSLVDTWLLLQNVEADGERNRTLYILKSRGMAHSNQVREFLLTGRGVDLQDAYLGPHGVLTGSARQSQEARERAEALARRQKREGRKRERERRREALEARIAAMRKTFDAEEEEARRALEEEERREESLLENREHMAVKRRAELKKEEPVPPKPRKKTK